MTRPAPVFQPKGQADADVERMLAGCLPWMRQLMRDQMARAQEVERDHAQDPAD